MDSQCAQSHKTVGSTAPRCNKGATILGSVLSSDKTNVMTMTGARVTHLLLLGLANIRMCTHTKLSSKAFMLMALLPIPQYFHPNQQMQGMLQDCHIHECLSINLQPLMKAAKLGIMMSDPVGNIRHCFTPLLHTLLILPRHVCAVKLLHLHWCCTCSSETTCVTLHIHVPSLSSSSPVSILIPTILKFFFAACAEF
ncbi:hypothetical protein P692DRAFT_201731226 [Suillus brevipes Sb2]|nr:hypothetical protein P692DRAFT_201731226 [Suillus brevipes Sb2]